MNDLYFHVNHDRIYPSGPDQMSRPRSRILLSQWILAVVVGSACTAPAGSRDAALPAPSAATIRPPALDHVSPRRDAVGTTPTGFEWTRVAGADRYAIGIWNEVDMLMWRRDDVTGTAIAWPADLQLEFGTYYWGITALRDDRPIADSGRAAFVIVR